MTMREDDQHFADAKFRQIQRSAEWVLEVACQSNSDRIAFVSKLETYVQSLWNRDDCNTEEEKR